ncbi:proton-coupled amino acid transporter-like protein CG1139, partial [Hyposmocoma kahamanoa]|uniref:proton-coupled amino acid transporter-like protein CG1139 n=1 Tax=Hyposmocoma kahamanoa TaxID=1477025 RepID=UPI000E6D93F0
EVADWSLALTNFGVCCVYVVIIAECFKQISDDYVGPSWSVSLFCALCLVVLVPLSQITTLKYLVPFSTFANFMWLGSICICLYYCLKEPPAIKDRSLAKSITGIPSFITTCAFAMEAIALILPLENEMTKPQQFLGCPGVLNIAMTTIVIFYGFVGFSGYWQFGNDVSGSLILSLPQDEILAQAAKILVACVMILSFTLIYYIPIDFVWKRLQDQIPARRQSWTLSGIRLLGTLII